MQLYPNSTRAQALAIALSFADLARKLLVDSRNAAADAMQKEPPTDQREPAKLFDADYYLCQIPEQVLPREPYTHFLSIGLETGLKPHPLIDPERIMAQLGEPLVAFDLVALAQDPRWWTVSSHSLFDPVFYLATNPDVAMAGVCPLTHYLHSGWRENRRPNPLFDNFWYLATNLDVLRDNICPLVHYVMQGSGEGRAPMPYFDAAWYLARYPDVQESGMEPFSHFVIHGLREGRLPSLMLRRLDRSDLPTADLLALAMTSTPASAAEAKLLHGPLAPIDTENEREKVVAGLLDSQEAREIFSTVRARLAAVAV
jgi:hypothetical protein